MDVNMQKIVTKIEANPLLCNTAKQSSKLRVAAYCRVSTDEEEQLNSYEAQIAYYTEAIAKNPSWTFAGIYADEGITGTVTSKRKDFLRLMNDCEKGKVDMILTKSISRFARNTVDSLSWVRKLRAMNVGVYFEEQAIDSLKAENEMLIGLFSVIAQAESENISANVKWGIQQSMKNFSCFGYKRGDNGIPQIVPEQAETVRVIFDRYLEGDSVDQIKAYLERNNHKTLTGKSVWDKKLIRNMLQNEKYVGDLMLQKTYRPDCLSKKTKVNKGELPKYLISNNHPAIIERTKFNKVQMEMARRSSKHKRSSVGITEQAKYSGKYALSELLVCGECGSSYRRTGKTKNGKRKYVWRCLNRIENGQNVCDAIGAEEQKLHTAICRCLNKLFSNKNETIRLLENNLRYVLSENDETRDAYVLEKQISDLTAEAESLMEMMSKTDGDTEKYLFEIENKYSQIKALRQKLDVAKRTSELDDEVNNEFTRIISLFQDVNANFEEFDDRVIRRLVECIRVMKDRRIVVVLKGGLTAEETI